jgi:hypothetical protein
MKTEFQSEILNGKNHLRGLGIGWKIVLKSLKCEGKFRIFETYNKILLKRN